MSFIEKVKNLWHKIVAWVKGATNAADNFITKYAPVAVSVINWIKEFNESATADIIETILANVANKYGQAYVPTVRKWLEENLPKIIDALNLANEVAEAKTVSEKLLVAKEFISKLPEGLNATTWANLSALLANALADEKLSISEALAVIGYVYENFLNK